MQAKLWQTPAALQTVRDFSSSQNAQDDACTEAFIALYTPLVERVVRKILRNGDAEQVVVDVFFRLWQKRAKLPPGEGATFYILRVAHNVAVDAYRRAKRDQLAAACPLEDAPQLSDDSAKAALYTVELREMMAFLEPRERTLFLQFYYEGHTAAKLATQHGIKLPTVYTVLRRAKIKLNRSAKGDA